MAVDDLWFSSRRSKGPDGKLLPAEPTKRHGRGKRYRVRYIDDTGKSRQQLFEKKPAADAFDANTRADLSRGQYVDPAAGKATVAEYGAQWRAIQLHRDSTAARVEQAFRLHIDPVLGRLRIAQVRPSQVQSWVKDRSAYLAPSTLHVVYGYLASMFAAAALDRARGPSPCGPWIRLPEVDHGERFVPSPDQVHAIADALSFRTAPRGPAAALSRRYAATVYVAAGCGLRQGETWGLELEHVNFLRREISVVQQLVTATGRAPFLAPVKTKTSRRTVEMGQVVAESLARHIELYPPVEVEIDDETDPRRTVRRKALLIFVNANGDPIRRTSWSPIWTPAVAAAGLPEGFGYHGLRHHFATLLIHAGANVKTVQLALGHSTPMITLNTYAHEWPDAIDRTRTLVDAALTRSSSTTAKVGRR